MAGLEEERNGREANESYRQSKGLMKRSVVGMASLAPQFVNDFSSADLTGLENATTARKCARERPERRSRLGLPLAATCFEFTSMCHEAVQS